MIKAAILFTFSELNIECKESDESDCFFFLSKLVKKVWSTDKWWIIFLSALTSHYKLVYLFIFENKQKTI